MTDSARNGSVPNEASGDTLVSCILFQSCGGSKVGIISARVMEDLAVGKSGISLGSISSRCPIFMSMRLPNTAKW